MINLLRLESPMFVFQTGQSYFILSIIRDYCYENQNSYNEKKEEYCAYCS